jgi:hypothetical protein
VAIFLNWKAVQVGGPLIWINSLAFRGADYASDASCEASANRRCRVVQPGKRTIAPDVIQFAPRLPKTRSGKIMRRILRKIAENEFAALGDTRSPIQRWSKI